MANAPSINNYYVGKGVISFKKDEDTDFVDCGNVPEFEWTPEVEKLDHFSSREGVRQKDRTIVLEKKGTIRMVMEEWNVRNLAIALLGEVSQDTEGNSVIEIFASNAVSGALKFTGSNEVGPKFEWVFNRVDFIPSSSISPLSDEWGQLEVTGEAAAVDGSFGTVTLLAEEGSELPEE